MLVCSKHTITSNYSRGNSGSVKHEIISGFKFLRHVLEGCRRPLEPTVCKMEVLQRIKEESGILRATERRRANWIRHILRRNCTLKHIFKGNIEGTEDEEGEVSVY